MRVHVTTERRNALAGLRGLALSALLLGFIASPSLALSMTGTYTDMVGGSLGITGSIPELVAGLAGSPGSGRVGDFPNVTNPGDIAAFSNTVPVPFSLPGDTFLFIDGKLKLGGSVKTSGSPVTTAFVLGTKHTPDLFFADGHVRQSGPSPASLLLFGATLVGLGLVVRRRMGRATTSSV